MTYGSFISVPASDLRTIELAQEPYSPQTNAGPGPSGPELHEVIPPGHRANVAQIKGPATFSSRQPINNVERSTRLVKLNLYFKVQLTQ